MPADWIKLMIAAAVFPLRSDPANNQFERPSAHGLILFSTGLLSMGTAAHPSSASKNTEICAKSGHRAPWI
jgi:hypothetical protein